MKDYFMALAKCADTEQVSMNISAQNNRDPNEVANNTGSESSWDSDAGDQKEMVKQQRDSSRANQWAQAIINDSCLGTDPALIYKIIEMSRERYFASVSAR